jgi:ribonuclease-3
VEETGPDHQKMFRVEVRIAGDITAIGTGKTKKEAEQLAAVEALNILGAERT